jgi:hypothetical protein
MIKYMNRSGSSGVYAFQTTVDSITVQFNNGTAYLYTHAKPGFMQVEKMKQLATIGSRLNSYISTTIKKGYQSKLR